MNYDDELFLLLSTWHGRRQEYLASRISRMAVTI
jgi:hypothetical protein